nr:C40 family peptidase [Bacteroidota bacterium]
MEHGFCHLSAIPVRSQASHRSEMINQLLFGETYEVVDAVKGWKLIRGTMDKYEGYIDENQFTGLYAEEYLKIKSLPSRFPAEFTSYIKSESGEQFLLLLGSTLTGLENQLISIGNYKFHYTGNTLIQKEPTIRDSVVKTAFRYLHVPYLWGGRSPLGIDCSGLVQVAFMMNGIKLERDSSEQSQQGETLNLISEARDGDLIFFDNEDGNIIHVGIFFCQDQIIHASGSVRIDKVDHNGIFNADQKKYTHNLRLIKRIISE